MNSVDRVATSFMRKKNGTGRPTEIRTEASFTVLRHVKNPNGNVTLEGHLALTPQLAPSWSTSHGVSVTLSDFGDAWDIIKIEVDGRLGATYEAGVVKILFDTDRSRYLAGVKK